MSAVLPAERFAAERTVGFRQVRSADVHGSSERRPPRRLPRLMATVSCAERMAADLALGPREVCPAGVRVGAIFARRARSLV